MERQSTFRIGGLVTGALAVLVALAIIVASIGWRPRQEPLRLATYPLGDAAPSVWTLLAACAVLGLVLSALGRRRRAGAAPSSSPAAGAGEGDPLEVVQGCAEVALLILGGISALMIFLDGIRLFVVIRDRNAVWAMFLACSALLVFSAAKGAALRKWLAREGAGEPDGGWQTDGL